LIWNFHRLGAKARAIPSILCGKAHQKMTQRPIVAYISLKWMSACEIHDDIVAILGPDAVSYSSVTRYFCEARFPPSKPESRPADVQRDLDDSDQMILTALEENSFASVWQLSQLTHLHLPSTTAYRLLTQSLGFVACRLRWFQTVIEPETICI
jgi:hypothetical protein